MKFLELPGKINRVQGANVNKWVRALSVLVALGSVAVAASARQANGIGGMTISPLMFRTPVSSGTRIALPIEIHNLQQDVLHIHVDIVSVLFQDWTYIPNFNASHARDCANWFENPSFDQAVRPGAEARFSLQAKVLHVRPGVYWCMARVTPHYENDNSTVEAQYQIPVILLVGPQPRPILKIGSPELVQVNDASEIHIPFESGNGGFTAVGAKVELRQASTGRVVGHYFDSDRNLYPDSKRNLTFPSVPLDPGTYVVTSTPQAGTRSFAPISREYVVTKSGIKPMSADASLELSPVTFDPGAIHLEMPAGATRSAVFHLVNNSDKTITADIFVKSLGQNADGAFHLGQDQPSGNLHVDLDPPSVILDPGRTTAVRIAVSCSRQSSGDLWFGMSANVRGMNSVAEEIYGNVSVPGGQPKLQLEETELKKLGQYPYLLRFEVKNTGNMSLKPLPFAQVLEQGLDPIANLKVPVLGSGGILPGSVLNNEVMLPPDLKPGAYTVNVKYQYGEDLFANLTVPITVPGKAKKGEKK